MSLICDITGNDPLFRLTGLRYRISKPSSIFTLKLPQVGYSGNCVIKKVNSNGGLDTLTKGTHYSFSGRDETTEGLVRAAYPGFSGELYDSIDFPVVTFGSDAYITVIIEYQSVFPNVLTSAVDQSGSPEGPTCTPELLKQIIEDLIVLKGTVNGEEINYSTAQSLPSPLATDYTGVLPDNFISDEQHIILANDGKVVVRPANGSFYDHELVVRDANGVELVRETDYTVRGMDVAATKVCEHPSGVWRFIIITKNITGMVYISYHAFGGEVNVQNFLAIRDQVQALKDYIDKGSFITAESLGGAPVMQSVLERLNTLDRYYRSLNMSGYRDMSNRYIALPDSNHPTTSNWYRIAYLYKPCNSHDDLSYFRTYTKDSVRLKIRLENSGIILDMFVYANVMNGTLNLSIQEADSDTGSSDPSDYSNLKSVVLPQFRLVWRKDGDYQYGAVLQIKLPIPTGYDREIINVENHNKAGLGGWILRGDANGTDEVPPENDTVQLPDEEHVWISNGSSSVYGSTDPIYPAFKKGTILWAGSVPFNYNAGTGKTLIPCGSGTINPQAIRTITFMLFDRVLGQYIKKTVASNAIDETGLVTTAMFDELDQSSLIFKLTSSTMVVYMRPGTKSNLLNRFDLRQIYINATEA